MKFLNLLIASILLMWSCTSRNAANVQLSKPASGTSHLTIQHNESTGSIAVFKAEKSTPVLTQQAQENIRPYIHPIIAPDGKGILTQFSPGHHKHQTGLYWGLKEVNGRDYFMNWQADYWRKISAQVLQEKGKRVRWQTVYGLLDEDKQVVLTETQNWAMEEKDGRYILDLEWKGEAKKDVVIGKFYVGGLFLRMPWQQGIQGRVINAAGQVNQEGEGQRAIWCDIGIGVQGRNDLAHIAIFDHPDNAVFPTPWRIDNELGIGPSRQILGEWQIENGKTAVFRYRLVVYTGEVAPQELTNLWKTYICEQR